MECVALSESVWVLHGSVNIGLIRTAEGLVAIDTGLDKQSGKAVLRMAAEMDLPLAAIVNTHAHADHFGGNAIILSRQPVQVYAPAGEADVLQRPAWEPEYLWQGASPFAALQNKFLQAEPSKVDVAFQPGDFIDVGGLCVQTVSLPGHARSQAGIVAHGVLFAADAYFDAQVTDKHGIPYMVDYTQTLTSAKHVLDVEAEWTVPGHGVPAHDVKDAVLHLCHRHESVAEEILNCARTPKTLDDLIAEVCQQLSLNPTLPGSYLLLRTPIAAYITAAIDAGELRVYLDRGRMWFERT